MRIILLLIASLVGIHFALWAQEASVFQVKAGQIVMHIIPFQEQYYYTEFQPGTVWFWNGKSLSAKLNYNLLYREMQYIDAKGDTLALKEDYSIKKFAIGEDLFYQVFKIGYVELVTTYTRIKLARKQSLEIIRSDFKLVGQSKLQTVGGTWNTGSGYSPGYSYKELYTQKAPGAIDLAKQTSYFLMDNNERFYQAKKSTLLKLFPRHKKTIEQYLKKNQTNFTREEDLNKLLEFCSQLARKGEY